jgi:hypothetical protein
MNPAWALILLVGAFGLMGTLLLRDGILKWKKLKRPESNKLKELIQSPVIIIEIFGGTLCLFFILS